MGGACCVGNELEGERRMVTWGGGASWAVSTESGESVMTTKESVN